MSPEDVIPRGIRNQIARALYYIEFKLLWGAVQKEADAARMRAVAAKENAGEETPVPGNAEETPVPGNAEEGHDAAHNARRVFTDVQTLTRVLWNMTVPILVYFVANQMMSSRDFSLFQGLSKLSKAQPK